MDLIMNVNNIIHSATLYIAVVIATGKEKKCLHANETRPIRTIGAKGQQKLTTLCRRYRSEDFQNRNGPAPFA
jgi:hypothetical protein